LSEALFRFYAELNDFLPPHRRMVAFGRQFLVSGSVKDMIESLGVPHTEVDLILANGVSVDFNYQVQHQDRISVYPVFEALDITPLLRVRSRPLREIRFVLDVHLGRLAAYLRMLGFDTAYCNNIVDEEVARISVEESRVLLTRDIGLLKRSVITHGYYVRETIPRKQLREVVERFDLSRQVNPFSRCLECNSPLETAGKEQVQDIVPSGVADRHQDFARCPSCRRVFWKGSHFHRMKAILESIGIP